MTTQIAAPHLPLANIDVADALEAFFQCKVLSMVPQPARHEVYKVELENQQTWYVKRKQDNSFVHERAVASLKSARRYYFCSPDAHLMSSGNAVFALLSEVKAQGNEKINDDLTVLAKGLVSVHNLPIWPELNQLMLPEAEPLLHRYFPHYKQALLPLLDWLMRKQQNQPVSAVLHGDLTEGNCFYSKDNKLGLIDWDFASIGNPLWDIATLVIEFNWDEHKTRNFVTEYQRQMTTDKNIAWNDIELWCVYYWLVARDWAEKNDYQVDRYRQLEKNVSAVVDGYLSN